MILNRVEMHERTQKYMRVELYAIYRTDHFFEAWFL
jgi:hypothetical protein